MPVPGFEGLYEVSNLGRVFSLERVRKDGIRVPSKFLTPCLVGPRWAVVLYKDGKRHHSPVHQLVLKAFIGPRPDGYDACHCDGDRDNNRLDNLRWDTRSANTLDQVAHGTHHMARRTHCPRGHEHTKWNVRSRPSRPLERECRACALARGRHNSAKKYGRFYDFEKGADEIYAELARFKTLRRDK